MNDLFEILTAEQLAAVLDSSERIHVSAGPGTGKTLTLAARIAWLLQEGAEPDQIICCTFTRSACESIRTRVREAVGPLADRVQICTFHEAALVHGPSGQETVASAAEADAAVRSLYEGPTRRPSRGLPSITELRDAIVQYEAAGGAEHALELRTVTTGQAKAVALVASRLRAAGLMATWSLVPRFIAGWRLDDRDYQHVLVDECQDTTVAEAQMAGALLHGGGALFLVGDQRQAIMGWRGADPRVWFHPTHALTHTFRFGEAIAAESNRLEVGEPITGSGLAASVMPIGLDQLGEWLSWSRQDIEDTAVLCRTHADATAIERLLGGIGAHVRRDPLDALSSPADRIRQVADQGLVPILTVHAAKGREWDQVVVVGPSSIAWGEASEDDEELRVLYVAMTRARHRLVLVRGEPRIQDWRVKACGISAGEAVEARPIPAPASGSERRLPM